MIPMGSILARRLAANPLLTPAQVKPSSAEFRVAGVFNPGAFAWEGYSWLLARVAERPVELPSRVGVAEFTEGRAQIKEFAADDPDLNLSDPGEVRQWGRTYLSVLLHLRLFVSDDEECFAEVPFPFLVGHDEQWSAGIEDARVTRLEDNEFAITYAANSMHGYAVGLRLTRDWISVEHFEMILPPANKDAAIFPQRVGERHLCLHRPSGGILGGKYMWIGFSDGLRPWGDHRCIAHRRHGHWDEASIGGGCVPIETAEVWLVIYHGADRNHRYCLGAMLLDLQKPWRMMARSEEPLLEPDAPFEGEECFPNVVFANGHIVIGEVLDIYYGAADARVAGVLFSIAAILSSLRRT
jgi:beta-1,2-mannobiose phosphorylase / 1,2-beta-oligomannan phosphorylase